MISQLARKGHHKASNGGSSTPEAAYQTVQYLLIAQVDQALGASMQGAALRNMTVWQSHHWQHCALQRGPESPESLAEIHLSQSSVE